MRECLFLIWYFYFALQDEKEYTVSYFCLPSGLLLCLSAYSGDSLFWALFFLVYALFIKLICLVIFKKDGFGEGDIVFFFVSGFMMKESFLQVIIIASFICLIRIFVLKENRFPFVSCLFCGILLEKLFTEIIA